MVSLIIPVYNEEKYIYRLLNSIEIQDYPKEMTEIIFIDGMSKDNTRKILDNWDKKEYNKVIICDNEKTIIPCALNIGIKNATGDYIVRLDAHSEYPSDYVSKCVDLIERTNADNVGGIVVTQNEGFVGKAISYVMSSKFGVGNSGFRTNGESGYAETVPFGTFKKETFEKFGLYDERLVRNEDNEMNYRIRKSGGKIYMDSSIRSVYHSRDSVSGLIKMAFANGKWNIITFFMCPGAMSIRHFIPFLFVVSLVVLGLGLCLPGIIKIAAAVLLGCEILLYSALDICFSVYISSKNGFKYLFMLIALFPIFHISYGIGSVAALFKAPFLKGKK